MVGRCGGLRALRAAAGGVGTVSETGSTGRKGASAVKSPQGGDPDEGIILRARLWHPDRPYFRRTPLGLQISQEVRRQILFGHLNPLATPLTQQDLCDRFGTSRMPVRDAINMLVMDGLATRPNNRDAVVADITLEDILDAFEVNAHLHALAAVRAITRGTPRSATAC